MKNKKLTAFLTGVLSLALVAGAWAYYSSTAEIDNKLTTKGAGGEQTVEEFTPDEDWFPGETVDKKVGVENTGSMPLLVRIKLDEAWYALDEDGNETGDAIVSLASTDLAATLDADFLLADATTAAQDDATDGLVATDKSVVYKALSTSTDWVDGGDGYFYYKNVLAEGATTANLLESITLCNDTDMGKFSITNYYTTATAKPANDAIGTSATDAATKWVALAAGETEVPEGATFSRSVSVPDATAGGYANAAYHLIITTETYQATAEARAEAIASDDWDSTATPAIP